MIGQLFQSGRYVIVSGGSTTNYITAYSGLQDVGNMRYNTSSQCIEVFDGTSWQRININTAHVGLSPEAEQILDWANRKRLEDIEIEQLAKENAAVKDLVDQIKEKQHQLKMIQTLIK